MIGFSPNGGIKHCSTFLNIIARGLILWYCWWHGGYGNTGMVACLKGHHKINIIMQNIRDDAMYHMAGGKGLSSLWP